MYNHSNKDKSIVYRSFKYKCDFELPNHLINYLISNL